MKELKYLFNHGPNLSQCFLALRRVIDKLFLVYGTTVVSAVPDEEKFHRATNQTSLDN